jgi:hypothetical protein
VAGDIEALLTELSAAGVRYVVGGGVAVVLHGFMRAAFDLELIVDPDANLERARSILARSPNTATVRPDTAFADLHRRAMAITIGNFTFSIVSIDDVIAMKRHSCVAQDAVDIQALETLRRPKAPDEPFDGSFEGTRRRQILAGLEVSPIELLRWLDRWNSEVRSLLGRAS